MRKFFKTHSPNQLINYPLNKIIPLKKSMNLIRTQQVSVIHYSLYLKKMYNMLKKHDIIM